MLLSGTAFTHGYTVEILASCGRYLRWRLVGADIHLCKVSNLFIWCIPKFTAKNYIPRLLSLLFCMFKRQDSFIPQISFFIGYVISPLLVVTCDLFYES